MQRSSIQTFIRNNLTFQYTICAVLLLAAFFAAISAGSVFVPFSDIVRIILHRGGAVQGIDPSFIGIVYEIRLPRVLLACLVGASLALAGGAFQALLRNPLADPYTLGVSSGASVGAVSSIYFGINFLGIFTLPLFSILAAALTMFLVLLFAYAARSRTSMETLILAGVIANTFLGSFISLIIALTGDELREVMNWLLGSVSMRGWPYVQMILPFVIIGSAVLFLQSRELNAFAFGDERAHNIGMKVKNKQITVIIAASVLTGAAVAVSGAVGFVGLVIPHICRFLFGSDNRHLLPLSMMAGGGLLILADLLARTLISPAELPIGVITSIIGAPVFAAILFSNRK
ncbi:iron ABC transporter permease [Metabacillus sp. GX 13764]|uniref:FecCD family ABC transporter permease n=1 Tax=Metabacillus kandeliae TaxID=2900151 RepID=UPI001E407950|nr:iron ABC transporter permease [Metabacillus kandeliae]MCD7035507.1 iron ABC transporter permease [Metabacillus kandeliae]